MKYLPLNVLLLLMTHLFCTQAQPQPPNPFGKALIPDMNADASIQMINGIFYCYATTDGYDKGLETSGPPCGMDIEGFCELALFRNLFSSSEE